LGKPDKKDRQLKKQQQVIDQFNYLS